MGRSHAIIHALAGPPTTAAALPAAIAQSNVQIYGLLDAGYEYATHAEADGGAALRQITHGKNTSRWGLRGSEKLTPGMSAIWNLEGGVSVDTGANSSNLFRRHAWIGLDGKYGRIKYSGAYGPFKYGATFGLGEQDTSAADGRKLALGGSWTHSGLAFMLAYENINGNTVAATGRRDETSALYLGVDYRNGPWRFTGDRSRGPGDRGQGDRGQC